MHKIAKFNWFLFLKAGWNLECQDRVLSPILPSIYLDAILLTFKNSGVRFTLGGEFVEAFEYADVYTCF